MAVRKTQKDMYKEIISKLQEIGDCTEYVDFLNGRIELLEKKNASTTKTKVQIENEGLKEKIVVVLKNSGKALTIGEIQEIDTSLSGFTSSKMSALLKQLVDTEVVKKEYIKKKAYFSII